MAKKLLSISLMLVLALSSLLLGCAKPVSAQEIANRSVAATPEVSSVKMAANLTFDLASTGTEEDFSLSMALVMSSVIDAAAKEMQATATLSMDMAPLGDLEMSLETFLIDQWVYTGMDFLGAGKTWMKSRMTEEDWQAQNQLEQQADFLKSASETTKLGEETIDGVRCYVLEIKPDLEALMDWLMSQSALGMEETTGAEGFDFSQLDLSKMFKNFTIKEWIAQDSYLVMKAEIETLMEMSEKDFVPTATASTEKVTMTIKMDLKFYDYNKPVNISLPPEAATAREVSAPS